MTEKTLLNVRIDIGLKEHLERIAQERKESLSDVVRDLIERQIERVRKNPDEIRFDLIRDDKVRYVKELELEGFRVIDISTVIFDELKVEIPPVNPKYVYLLIMDRQRSEIWIETPHPAIAKGGFRLVAPNGEYKSFNLYPDVFNFDDFDRNEIEIKQKLTQFIRKQNASGSLILDLEPLSDYVRLYKTLGASLGIEKRGQRGAYELREEFKGNTFEEAVDRALGKVKGIIMGEKHSKPYRPAVSYFDNLEDTLWLVLPDANSAGIINKFTNEEKERFVRYLGNAWEIYFDTSYDGVKTGIKAVEGDAIIIKLPKHKIKPIDEAVEAGNAKDVSDTISRAIVEWCDRARDPKKSSLSVSEGRPFIKKAMEEGVYKNPQEVTEDALNLLERRLSRYPM